MNMQVLFDEGRAGVVMVADSLNANHYIRLSEVLSISHECRSLDNNTEKVTVYLTSGTVVFVLNVDLCDNLVDAWLVYCGENRPTKEFRRRK
ncbi:hypothetical protein ACO03_02945 [Pantoea ananatis]|nr:hypothetical protein ACO03_02945 [Pantoea ananatis]